MTPASKVIKTVLEEILDEHPRKCGECGEKFSTIEDAISISQHGMCDECWAKFAAQEFQWPKIDDDGRDYS